MLPINFLFGRPVFFYTREWCTQNNSEDQVRATKNYMFFAKSKKRLPNRTSNAVLLNKNSSDISKNSEKGTYKNHF